MTGEGWASPDSDPLGDVLAYFRAAAEEHAAPRPPMCHHEWTDDRSDESGHGSWDGPHECAYNDDRHKQKHVCVRCGARTPVAAG